MKKILTRKCFRCNGNVFVEEENGILRAVNGTCVFRVKASHTFTNFSGKKKTRTYATRVNDCKQGETSYVLCQLQRVSVWENGTTHSYICNTQNSLHVFKEVKA